MPRYQDVEGDPASQQQGGAGCDDAPRPGRRGASGHSLTDPGTQIGPRWDGGEAPLERATNLALKVSHG
jgi:hypothetical protein